MKNTLIKKLSTSVQDGQRELARLSVSEKDLLEKQWDIEHAYYSSALEGSNIGRKEFEELAKDVS